MVCVVRLLCELRSRRAGPNPRLHQPATKEQRFRLQWTSKRNTAVSCFSLPGFVHKRLSIDFIMWQVASPLISFHWLYYPQMTFALGRLGHLAPVAVAQAQCQGAGRAFVRQRATRRVLLRSKRRGTAKRLNCATNSLVQVHNGKHKTQKIIGVIGECDLTTKAARGVYNLSKLS